MQVWSAIAHDINYHGFVGIQHVTVVDVCWDTGQVLSIYGSNDSVEECWWEGEILQYYVADAADEWGDVTCGKQRKSEVMMEIPPLKDAIAWNT